MKYNIVLHQYSTASNIRRVNWATWKNAKWNSETLNQCNIKTVQHLIVQYYNSTILNSATITIVIATSATATSTIRQ